MKNGFIWGMFVLLLLPLALGAELRQLSVHAPSVSQGEPVTLTYTLVDDNAIGRVITDTYLPGGINHQTTETNVKNRYQHQETFILPQDYAANSNIFVRIRTTNDPARTYSIPLQTTTQQQTVEDQTTQQLPQAETGVILLVDPVRDVLRGGNVYYRVQVFNTDDQPHTVQVGLSDVGDWATYRVDPQPVFTIQPNEKQDAYIYLKVDDNAQPGVTYFDVTATYGQVQERAGVKIAVLQPLQTSTADQLKPYIIGLAVLLVLAAIIFVIYAYGKNKDNENGGDDDDFITYY